MRLRYGLEQRCGLYVTVGRYRVGEAEDLFRGTCRRGGGADVDGQVAGERNLAEEGAGGADLRDGRVREGADVVLDLRELVGQVRVAHGEDRGLFGGTSQDAFQQIRGGVGQ